MYRHRSECHDSLGWRFLPTISIITVCIAPLLPNSPRRTGLCHGNKYENWLLTDSDAHNRDLEASNQ